MLLAYNKQSFTVGHDLALIHDVGMLAYRMIVEQGQPVDEFLALDTDTVIRLAVESS